MQCYSINVACIFIGNAEGLSESVDKTEAKASNSEPIQLEPTKDEMEQERLMSRFEQVREKCMYLCMLVEFTGKANVYFSPHHAYL